MVGVLDYVYVSLYVWIRVAWARLCSATIALLSGAVDLLLISLGVPLSLSRSHSIRVFIAWTDSNGYCLPQCKYITHITYWHIYIHTRVYVHRMRFDNAYMYVYGEQSRIRLIAHASHLCHPTYYSRCAMSDRYKPNEPERVIIFGSNCSVLRIMLIGGWIFILHRPLWWSSAPTSTVEGIFLFS